MKILIVFICLCAFSLNTFSQKLVNVVGETITVNSVSSLSGWSRNKIEVPLPENTTGYIYRITSFPKNNVNITDGLFSVLKSIPLAEIKIGASLAEYAINNSNGSAIDYFIFTNIEDLNAFYKKDNANWSSCKSFPNVINVCRTSNECLNRTIYFGFRNNNITEGLDVHIEVVAIQDENKSSFSNYGFKILNEATVTANFELSLDGSTWESYSLKPNYVEEFTFTKPAAVFKITTTGKGTVEYKINSNERYKIAWNVNKGIWDLYTY